MFLMHTRAVPSKVNIMVPMLSYQDIQCSSPEMMDSIRKTLLALHLERVMIGGYRSLAQIASRIA